MPILSATAVTGRVVWLGLVRDRAASLRSTAVERVEARFEGFVGESHSGLVRPSCSRVAELHPKGTPIRNSRQVTNAPIGLIARQYRANLLSASGDSARVACSRTSQCSLGRPVGATRTLMNSFS